MQDRQLAQRLPHLHALLKQLTPGLRDEGNEYQLSAPHERARARHLGWHGADGALPWAAWQARQDGIDTLDLAWATITPLHWHMGGEHLSVVAPEALALAADESQALFDAVRPLFEDDGWILVWQHPTRWYAAHECLRDLPTASLDRVVGRNPDLWMPDHPQARTIRRLQSEVQMVWYTHPVNEEREARRQLPVNSFWLSGCGTYQPPTGEPPQWLADLSEPALSGNWAAWASAWQSLDAGALAQALDTARCGHELSITLCGERHAQTWHNRPSGWLSRWARTWHRPDVAATLISL